MRIDSFEKHIPGIFSEMGHKKYIDGEIENFKYDGHGRATADVYEGKRRYSATIKIDKEGEVCRAGCACSSIWLCEHLVALMYAMKDVPLEELVSDTSDEIFATIGEYDNNQHKAVTMRCEPQEKIRLVAELHRDGRGVLSFSLKIGKPSEKMYVVKNISSMLGWFDRKEFRKYGKGLAFEHDEEILDEESRKLLKFTRFIEMRMRGREQSVGRECMLKYDSLEEFLSFFKDGRIALNKIVYSIKYENPRLYFDIKRNHTRYDISLPGNVICIGKGKRACFLCDDSREIYIADEDFTEKVEPFYRNVGAAKQLVVTEADMPAFYNSVLKYMAQYVDINGLEELEEYKAPEIEVRLFVDAPDRDVIEGRLEYVYDDKTYPFNYDKSENPYCDYGAEYDASTAVMKYFSDSPEGLMICDEQKIYDFVSGGIDELTRSMDVYMSGRFKNIIVRPAARPSVGIRPQSDLLQLEITAEGYTQTELLELLGAYRRGQKYHRLKDGSFAAIDTGMSELDEIADSLNITDKAMLKEKITVPKYRMLYLDSLQSDPNGMRVSRSRDFKKMIREYHSCIDDAQTAAIPQSLDGVMRGYQEYGFRWLKTIETYGFGGILADDMGLGKTLQALALMLDAKENGKGQSLVVCPASLTLNWKSEIEKFAPQLNCAVVIGAAKARREILENSKDCDVVVTPYQTLVRDIAEYENRRFHLHFIDEAQYIKNHGTQMAKAVKAVNSEVRFALTGTPVENSLAELWSIFDFIMPGYLFKYTYFKKTYETPIVRHGEKEAAQALTRLTSPFLLRRLKKEVLTELPDKTETVLRTTPEEEQSKLYSANVAELKQILTEGKESGSNRGTDKFTILAHITRLRQVCCDPSLVYENYNGGSAKLDMCMDLAESCINAGHKILLFSQFTSMLDRIAIRLRKAGISYFMLTGATKPRERLKLVNAFNNDNTNIFLISLKAGGTGLNLTGADIVIHYDPWWNSSAENQASDRAYRIGQKRNVQIYKLIVAGTIEEKIVEMQRKKTQLSELAVMGEGDIMKMDAEDIMALL